MFVVVVFELSMYNYNSASCVALRVLKNCQRTIYNTGIRLTDRILFGSKIIEINSFLVKKKKFAHHCRLSLRHGLVMPRRTVWSRHVRNGFHSGKGFGYVRQCTSDYWPVPSPLSRTSN